MAIVAYAGKQKASASVPAEALERVPPLPGEFYSGTGAKVTRYVLPSSKAS
jgi:hypothetical protein